MSNRKTNEEKEIIKFIKQISGITPTKIELYKTAFTHKSALIADKSGQIVNNERLEFLGDSILNTIVTIHIFKKFPDLNEGVLTQTRAKLVNTYQLSLFNQQIGLNRFLNFNNSNLNHKHLYADTFEAFIGAFFLDKGFKKTERFIVKKIICTLNITEIIETETNHKSKLIELSQKNNFVLKYITEQSSTKTQLFVSKIIINDNEIALGLGNTKKEAEQKASYNALENLNNLETLNDEKNLN